MNRREFLRTSACCLATSVAVPMLLRRAWAADEPRRPNVVLIFADDQGYADLGCQGCRDIPTPHMDSIAANGVRFTDGYVTAPVCSPSRAGLLTGRYQQRFGHEHNPGAEPTAGLPPSEETIADRLKATGYATGIVGKWHLGMLDEQNPTHRGFDEFFGFLHGAHSYLQPSAERRLRDPIRRGLDPVEEKEYLTDAFAREATTFIERHKGEPFFLYVPFNAVHLPLEASESYLERFPNIHDAKRRAFAAMLSALDDGVGAILRKLREGGLEKDTLLFFISDNGGPTRQTTASNAPLRGYKGQMYEGGIRVPYLMQWKGRLPAGQVYSEPVSSLDVLPTALAAAGVKTPDEARLDGVDLAPYLLGANNGSPHETLFWRMGDKRAARKGRWKAVGEGDSAFELYDLASDIGERHNLAAEKPETVADLKAAYDAWEAETIEPLWTRKPFRRETDEGQGGGEGRLQRRFNQLDRNGDGMISAEEAPNPRFFQRMDANGDGVVTFDEAKETSIRARRSETYNE